MRSTRILKLENTESASRIWQMVLLLLFSLFNFNPLIAQPINIMISDQNSPEEPSICIDPNNPKRIVAAANLNNVYTSEDGGKTWSYQKVTSSFGVWGDPVIEVDESGTFYYFHLSNPSNGSWIDRIVCQASTDGGKSWSDGVGVGKDSTKGQDKQWVVLDDSGNIYMTWTQFDKYGSRDSKDSSLILFSKGDPGGQNWSKPIRISEHAGNCIDSSLTNEGAVPTLGPNGEVYVAWAGPAGLRFDRSLDGGKTWLDKDILVDSMKAGWNYEISGINRCNGLPVTACDRSGGKYEGTIYVNWTDQRKGANNTEVWLSKSLDGGDTWIAPIKVNNDTGQSQQFLTWMEIDQSTGYLYFVFYDRRNYSDDRTDVYYAISKDGGQTFENFILSEKPFIPEKKEFFGDYTNIAAVNGKVMPIWARMDSQKMSIWTADIYDALLTESINTKEQKLEVVAYPNPATTWVDIKFKTKKTESVSLRIFDLNGKEIIAYPANNYEKGKHIMRIPCDWSSSGKFVYELQLGEKVIRKKLVIK